MRAVREHVELLVIGGGTAGHIAAIQAAREGVTTSVIEAGTMLGGTMTEGGVFMPNHFHSTDQPVVQGIPWELFVKSREVEGIPIKPAERRRPVDTPGYYSHINVPIYATIAEAEALEAGVILHYGEFTGDIQAVGDSWEVTSYGRGLIRTTIAREIIDASGDADGARALGLEVEKAPQRQPGTLQYRIEDIDMQQVWKGEVQQLYEEALQSGRLERGDWAYFDTYPFLWLLQMGGHNSTHVYGCDTSDAQVQTEANIRGRQAMLRIYRFIHEEIPGGERAVLKTMYARTLSREGYRVIGEHRITTEEFLASTTYDDQICNAFNYIDLHNEDNGCEEVFHTSKSMIPKIPFRSLIPRGSGRILVAGRIISSDRKSLAGLRAQCTCMAMGQAAGAAAAIAIRRSIPSREVPAKEILAMTVAHGAVSL